MEATAALSFALLMLPFPAPPSPESAHDRGPLITQPLSQDVRSCRDVYSCGLQVWGVRLGGWAGCCLMGEDNKGHEAAGRNKSVCFSLEEAVPGGGAVCRSPAGTLQEHFRNVLGTLDLNDRMAQTHEAAITLFFLSHVLADSPAKHLQLIKVGQVPSGDPVPPVGPVPSGDPVPPQGSMFHPFLFGVFSVRRVRWQLFATRVR